MDSGWTIDPHDTDDRVVTIMVRRAWRFSFGTCNYTYVPEIPGVWFFNVEGTNLRLHGKW